MTTNPDRPAALSSPIAFGDPSTPIELYNGLMTVTQNGTSFQAKGKMWYEWLPSPSVRFELPDYPQGIDLNAASVTLTLELPEGTKITYAHVTEMRFLGNKNFVAGVVGERVVHAKDAPASYALFLLPNLESVRASVVIDYPKGTISASRNVLRGGGWIVTIDEVEKQRDVLKMLNQASGFAVTHIGRIERDDGKPFTAEEAWGVCDALGWYITFCCGRWTGPCLPHGFNASGNLLWAIWDSCRMTPYKQRPTWMDRQASEHFERPFAGYMVKWLDKFWKDVVTTAIHWHVEANASAGSIEGSIVLTQTAFELLSSVILVENYKWLSQDGHDKLAAADRMRLLFLWCGMPTDVPTSLTNLLKLAKAFNWNDSPTAMTEIRNTITHPTRKNREKYDKHSSKARAEVWFLGLWYLELCLLKLFDYNGTYGNRLVDRIAGQVTPVPWAASTPMP